MAVRSIYNVSSALKSIVTPHTHTHNSSSSSTAPLVRGHVFFPLHRLTTPHLTTHRPRHLLALNAVCADIGLQVPPARTPPNLPIHPPTQPTNPNTHTQHEAKERKNFVLGSLRTNSAISRTRYVPCPPFLVSGCLPRYAHNLPPSMSDLYRHYHHRHHRATIIEIQYKANKERRLTFDNRLEATESSRAMREMHRSR
jgi:hypothetical protein